MRHAAIVLLVAGLLGFAATPVLADNGSTATPAVYSAASHDQLAVMPVRWYRTWAYPGWSGYYTYPGYSTYYYPGPAYVYPSVPYYNYYYGPYRYSFRGPVWWY